MSRCTNISASKVLLITELIHTALRNDVEARANGRHSGNAELNANTKIESLMKVYFLPGGVILS